MGLICNCPAATAIPSIDKVACGESFGQIQKVAFCRIFSSGSTKNSFTSAAAIDKLASWSTKLAANDGTKVVVSPYIEAPTSEAGAARTFGGGNETLGGIERIIGREPTPFTGVMRSVPQSVVKQMKELQCEADAGNLGVFLFDENGNIEAIQDESVATTFYPIPVRAFFVGDKSHGGLETPDSNAIQWQFAPNYSDNLKIVTPDDFNPLTDL